MCMYDIANTLPDFISSLVTSDHPQSLSTCWACIWRAEWKKIVQSTVLLLSQHYKGVWFMQIALKILKTEWADKTQNNQVMKQRQLKSVKWIEITHWAIKKININNTMALPVLNPERERLDGWLVGWLVVGESFVGRWWLPSINSALPALWKRQKSHTKWYDHG